MHYISWEVWTVPTRYYTISTWVWVKQRKHNERQSRQMIQTQYDTAQFMKLQGEQTFTHALFFPETQRGGQAPTGIPGHQLPPPAWSERQREGFPPYQTLKALQARKVAEKVGPGPEMTFMPHTHRSGQVSCSIAGYGRLSLPVDTLKLHSIVSWIRIL